MEYGELQSKNQKLMEVNTEYRETLETIVLTTNSLPFGDEAIHRLEYFRKIAIKALSVG